MLNAKVVATLVLVWPVMVAAQVPGTEPQSPGFGSAAAQPSQSMTIPAFPGTQNPFLGSTPAGQVTPGVLKLTLLDAIDRGLKYNLGLLLSSAQTDAARGARWRALSEIVPNLNGRVGESFQQINTAQFGFHFPGVPNIIGPFAIFDSRATATEDLSLRGLRNFRATSENIRAAEDDVRNAREVVVLAVGATYLQAIAAQARVESAQAQLTTAQTLYRQASDMKSAGVVAGIDVLRAQVEMQAERQRVVFAQNEFAKSLLTLGRVIGLPAAQQYESARKSPTSRCPSRYWTRRWRAPSSGAPITRRCSPRCVPPNSVSARPKPSGCRRSTSAPITASSATSPEERWAPTPWPAASASPSSRAAR